MFDKMIISDADAVESRGRGRYFLVSGLVVGVMFFSAVVFSIYAIDLDLGTEDFELSMMVAPVDNEPPLPKVDQPRSQPAAASTSKPAVRNAEILRIEEDPSKVPDSISTEKPSSLARPYGNYKIDPNALETIGGVGAPDGSPLGRGNARPAGSSSAGTAPPESTAVRLPEPPPVMKPPAPAKPISLGVINGKATSLPKPPYPAAAVAVQAQGEVSVQVTIDESGKVVSAKAVSGHLLLRRESERAAMNARFSPTLLSNVPVKVTGVIVYNFKR